MVEDASVSKSSKPPLSTMRGTLIRGDRPVSAAEGLALVRRALGTPPGEDVVEHAKRLMTRFGLLVSDACQASVHDVCRTDESNGTCSCWCHRTSKHVE